MKKKITAIIVTLSLVALALAACGSKPAEPQPAAPSSGGQEAAPVTTGSSAEDVVESGSAIVNPGMVTGGWTVNENISDGWATEQAKAAFAKAMEGMTGADYEIASLIGTQVVAGTNYMFICKSTTVTPNAVPGLSFVVVYEDLQGNAKVTNVEELDLDMFYGAENPSTSEQFEQLAGGWSIPEGYEAAALPEEVATAFTQAMKDKAGYEPVALLGSQLVSGNNYALLCFGDNAPNLVYIYAPLQGDAELTSIYKINMGEFSGN